MLVIPTKIASTENRGPLLAGLLGAETIKKEVRISSCAADEPIGRK
jgi:hypothetical protein